MGRPPIGKVAMTGAERVRRHRARMQPVTKCVTKPLQPQAKADQAKPQTDHLAPSAQAKLDAAKRVMERRLNAEHAARMRGIDEEVHQRVLKEGKEYLATLNEMEVKAYETERLYRSMIRPLFTAEQFKVILMCLHPDGSRTAEKLSHAFRLFNSKKLQLTGKK